MSDATNTCGRTKDTTVSGGTLSIPPTSAGVGISTDIVPQDTPDRVGQHDLSSQRLKHQTDRGDSLLVVSTGSSVTQSESNLHNGLETITPVFPVHEASHPIIEDKPKLNNKLNSLPLQPGIPSPNGNIDSLPKSTG
ncbi:unnamed protein product [Rhizoctonia solani]|uniref:Uncharacterized protein n=1 Tax=Rhizoctonia solani TaxID=456999 RepID=A0A8H3B9F2_9AGAM|nr:unnamed protein product [Rhizoctonia solani]